MTEYLARHVDAQAAPDARKVLGVLVAAFVYVAVLAVLAAPFIH